MEEKRVRISDIAEKLGLSTATVSNVLHGKTKKISDETVKRVQALLEERQYIPSMAGILLAQNSSKIIGVIINDHEKYEGHALEDAFIASSLNYLSEEIEKNDLFMMVKKTKNPEDIIKYASMWNMDGLIVIGFCDQDYEYLRTHMRIPFVVYDGYCEQVEGICNITIDNYNGGFQVGEYFTKCGHQRVLCISDNLICVDKDRYEGLCAGFKGGCADIMIVPMQKAERMKFYMEHIEEMKGYSAIFAVSDYYAVDLMQFFNEQKILVPDEIAIVGFDDTPMCKMSSPTLSSVKQDLAMRAQIALDKLKALKEKQETEMTIMLPVSFIERESSKKPK